MSSIKCITLEEERKKNPELKMSDIEILKKWCKEKPHLPKIQDMHLAIFLHSNYYQLEPTKNTIENYYTIRTHVSELFSNRDLKAKELQEALKVVANFRLEQKTKEGYNIIVGRLLDFEPSNYNYNNITKCALMVLDEFIWKYGSTSGFIFIGDTTGVSFRHLACFNPTIMKKYMRYIQDALPVRLIAFHIINTSSITELLFNTFKHLVNTDLLKLIRFHSSVETLNEYFPIEMLPNELGGKAGPIKELWDAQIKKLEDFQEWFLEDEKINRVNESLRIEKSKSIHNCYIT